MIIMCEDCGKKYRIDPDRITGPEGRFKCKNCGNPIVVSREALKRVVRPAAPVEPSADPAVPPPPGMPGSPGESSGESGAGFDATSLWKGSDEQEPQTDAENDEELGFDPEAARRLLAELSQVELSEEEGSDLGKVSGPGLGAPLPHAAQKGAGFTPKIIFLLLVVSLVPLAVFGAISLWQAKAQLGQSVVELNEEASTALTRQVDEWVDKNVRAMRAFAALSDMVTMDPAKQTPLLKAFAGEYPWVYLAFTVGPDGMNVARNDGKPLVSYADRGYYKSVMSGQKIGWQALIGKTSNKPALVFAVPILKNGQVVGTLATAMTLDDIAEKVIGWRRGETGRAFLVDDKGKVILHADPKLVAEQADLSANPLVAKFLGGAPGAATFMDGVNLKLGEIRPTSLGWGLAIYQDEAEATSSITQTQRIGIFILGITAILVILISLVAARRIVRPLRTLTDAADRISVGDLDVVIDIRSGDELGALAEAITRMQESVRLSIERLRRRR